MGNDTIYALNNSIVEKILPPKETKLQYKTETWELKIERIVKYANGFLNYEDVLSKGIKALNVNLKAAHQQYFVLSCDESQPSKLKQHLTTKYGKITADKVFDNIKTGKFPKLIKDALVISELSLSVTIEDPSQNWCHLIGEPVRGIIYEILHGSSITIQEYQRTTGAENDYKLKVVTAPKIFTSQGNLITLRQIHDPDDSSALEGKILYAVLGRDETTFKSIKSDNHKLLLAVTGYWFCKSCIFIEYKKIFLDSFLLYLLKMDKCCDNPKSRVPDAQEFVMHRKIRKLSRKSFVHCISEWQSLFYSVYCLNQIRIESAFTLTRSSRVS